MLDLDPAVQLEEERLAVGDDELGRAGVRVADRLGEADRGGDDLLPQRGLERGRGCLLEHLLLPALHRAVALEQMDAAAVRIREHLELDVPRLGQIFFQEHAIVAEARLRLAPGRAERSVERIVTLDDAHPLAPATGPRLDQYRVTDRVRLRAQARVLLVGSVITGHDRHSGFQRQAPDAAARTAERAGSHACALGKDDDAVAAPEDLASGVHRAGVSGAAVDGERSERVQKPPLQAALEELALGHVVDGTPQQRADDEGVEKAAVI